MVCRRGRRRRREVHSELSVGTRNSELFSILQSFADAEEFDQVEGTCASSDIIKLPWEESQTVQSHAWPLRLERGLPITNNTVGLPDGYTSGGPARLLVKVGAMGM